MVKWNCKMSSPVTSVTIFSGFHFSTDFVETTNKTQLVPNSGKFTFAVHNHTFKDPQAAGLAFRIFVISRGGVRHENRDTGFNTSKQGVITITDNVRVRFPLVFTFRRDLREISSLGINL